MPRADRGSIPRFRHRHPRNLLLRAVLGAKDVPVSLGFPGLSVAVAAGHRDLVVIAGCNRDVVIQEPAFGDDVAEGSSTIEQPFLS